jgi:uncharacterized RDD family membrane protein YckC
MIRLGGNWVCGGCKQVHIQKVKEGVFVAPAPSFRYGGFLRRFCACLLDAIILQMVFVPLRLAVGFAAFRYTPESRYSPWFYPMFILSYVLPFSYNCGMNWKFGGTVGKLALGMRIVMQDGSPISLGTAIGRQFAQIIDFLTLFIGYLIVIFDGEKRALHDRICSTRVILK